MDRCTYSSEFKLQVLLEALQSDGTDAEVARAHDVHPVTFSGWKTKLKENGSKAFSGSDELKERKEKIAKLERKGPLIMRWPKVTRPGTTTDEPVLGSDFFPTLLDAANVELSSNQPLNGISFVPVLQDASATLEREALYWHFPGYLVLNCTILRRTLEKPGILPKSVLRSGKRRSNVSTHGLSELMLPY